MLVDESISKPGVIYLRMLVLASRYAHGEIYICPILNRYVLSLFMCVSDSMTLKLAVSPGTLHPPAANVLIFIGPYGCISRLLALLNLRTTIAQLVLKFNIGFAQSEDGSKFKGNAREHFTVNKGPLNIVFTQRT